MIYLNKHYLTVQDVDNREGEAPTSASSQDPSKLPVVPILPQDRQAVLTRAPQDLAPALKAAADNLNNTADAQVCTSAYSASVYR